MKIYKAGEQSAADPFEFVMSSARVDLMGDIVEQDWKLADFRKNPIALFAHDSRSPIGIWKRVRIEVDRLLGKLDLAAAGTSEHIDTLSSLVEQRILRAVSVGFSPTTVEPLDEKEPWGGLRLSGNRLLECSLVSVPANPDAVSLAKQFADNPRALEIIAATGKRQIWMLPAAKQLKSRDSGTTSPKRNQHMPLSIAERVKAQQDHIIALRDNIESISNEIEDEITDDQLEQLEGLNDSLEKATKALGTLERTEKSMAVQAQQREVEKAKEVDTLPAVPRIHLRANKPKGFVVMAGMASMLKAHGTRDRASELAAAAYRDNPEVSQFVRAATAPADMTDATWASELVRETWSEFISLIRDLSVYPSVPGPRMDFDRFGIINMPRQGGRGQLAGGFVGEGAPIPVKSGSVDNVTMSPREMAVISTFTQKLADHSVPAIQTMVQDQILGDTAEVLDSILVGAGARDAINPAGFQDTTETGAANINAATAGSTVAGVQSDVTALLGRVYAARAGTGGVWIMNPLRTLGLANMQDAASGVFVYKAELASGMFFGYPVLVSQNITADVVSFCGDQSLAHGNDHAPRFSVSDQATLHMEDTTPLPIYESATPADPVRSMFQTNSVAMKMTLGMDWRIYRQGGIQVLTGVAW